MQRIPTSSFLVRHHQKPVSSRSWSFRNWSGFESIKRPTIPPLAQPPQINAEFERNILKNAIQDEAKLARTRYDQNVGESMTKQKMDQELVRNATQWIKRKTQLGSFRK